jgi:hypothetical protein
MHCTKCGAQNPDNASNCGSCGAALSSPFATPQSLSSGVGTKINNYLVPAIFATACCCLPFGIVSIIYAAQVNGKLSGGDVAGAQQAADKAKMWFWIAFGLGLVVQVIYIGLTVVGGGMSAMQQQQTGGGY